MRLAASNETGDGSGYGSKRFIFPAQLCTVTLGM